MLFLMRQPCGRGSVETPQQEKKVFFDACADCYKRQKVLFSICKIVASISKNTLAIAWLP